MWFFWAVMILVLFEFLWEERDKLISWTTALAGVRPKPALPSPPKIDFQPPFPTDEVAVAYGEGVALREWIAQQREDSGQVDWGVIRADWDKPIVRAERAIDWQAVDNAELPETNAGNYDGWVEIRSDESLKPIARTPITREDFNGQRGF